MGMLVVNGAQCQCSFGAAPSALTIVQPTCQGQNMPVATIMDNKPMVNIMPFGMCSSMSNPQVASATSAAMGVLTPMPCVPVISAPWAPGSTTVTIDNNPALNNSSKATCNWGGVIQIVNPGTTTVQVP